MTKVSLCATLLVFVSSLAYGQDYAGPAISAVHANQELRVRGLPSLRAASSDVPDVLATSLATVFNNKEICCERNSALEDRLPQSGPVSLKEVAAKVQGRQLLSDGRATQVKAEYIPADKINSAEMIRTLMEQHALLMEWNSRLYVVYGVVYDETLWTDGTKTYAISKFLLIDTRYSDERRDVSFNRATDDLTRVQGLLLLTAAPQ